VGLLEKGKGGGEGVFPPLSNIVRRGEKEDGLYFPVGGGGRGRRITFILNLILYYINRGKKGNRKRLN